MEATDAIEGLLRGLADDFRFGGVSADRRAAEGSESLAGIDARAIIDEQGFDPARDAERQERLALVGYQSAGAQDAGWWDRSTT